MSSEATVEKKESNPWWKSKRASQVGMTSAIVALLGICFWWFGIHPYASTEDARVAMTFVRIAPSNVGGRIEKVNITEGSKVKAGDILVEIDHRIPQANYDRAKAKSDLAARELARIQRLTAEGSATPQALDQARANAATATAELKLAEVALENTYLKSPFDGIVVQKIAEVGNLLEQNQVAAVVADENHAWVAANIEETSVGLVKVGQPVHIDIDEGGFLEGRVTEVRSSVASQFALIPSDSGAGNFTKVVQRVPIKVVIEDLKGLSLRAGQSVEIKIRVH
ncbi:MAG: HlyD family secretion protein [Pseudobdellovibrionaceae bacterium]